MWKVFYAVCNNVITNQVKKTSDFQLYVLDLIIQRSFIHNSSDHFHLLHAQLASWDINVRSGVCASFFSKNAQLQF